jgi:putative hemolysin
MPTEVLLLFALILLNGVFAISEIDLVTARAPACRQWWSRAIPAPRPHWHSTTIQHASVDDPGRHTSIGITSGIVGEAARRTAGSVADRNGRRTGAARLGATALVVIVVTYFSIVLGELVPKRLGQISAEGIARRVARPIAWLAMAANRSSVCCRHPPTAAARDRRAPTMPRPSPRRRFMR